MKFECKDMGMDCDFVATAATQEEVLDLAMTHAVEAHADLFKDITPEESEEMHAKLESVITDDAGEAVSEQVVMEVAADGDDEETEDEDEADEVNETESTEAA